jgi:hypothetical protein
MIVILVLGFLANPVHLPKVQGSSNKAQGREVIS